MSFTGVGKAQSSTIAKTVDGGFSMRAFAAEESGQDIVEYALVAVFMAFASIAILNGIASTLGNTFNHFGAVLTGSL